jgi:hypothetical protein
MTDSKPPHPAPGSPEENVEVVLGTASPKGEDVVVRMASLPKWWNERAPTRRRRRGAPPKPS